MPKILFLSHHPHECHLTYAQAVGAKVKIIPFNGYISLMKKYAVLNLFYPAICLIYSLFLVAPQDTLLVEGGSALYTAYFLKIRKPKLKIIYLDCDWLFYTLANGPQGIFKGAFIKRVIKKIDFCLSGSAHNQKLAGRLLTCPISLVLPYPRQMQPTLVERKNFGLYIGRLDPDKNLKTIIAFGLQCPYFEKFVVVGDGLLTDYVKTLSEREPKLLYHSPTNKTADFYSQCKFFIHLPKYDVYPCTTMEAALYGCFPIVSAGTGTAELFNNMFIVQNPNNFGEINQKIKYILDNEQNARQILEQNAKKIPQKNQCVEHFKEKFNEYNG